MLLDASFLSILVALFDHSHLAVRIVVGQSSQTIDPKLLVHVVRD